MINKTQKRDNDSGLERYRLNVDKMVNQLVPHYIGGRRIILYLQALLFPLQQLNDEFDVWAREKLIEASMTSQVFKFEWFLNHKMRRYFLDPSGMITIRNRRQEADPVYYAIEDGKSKVIRRQDEEGKTSSVYSQNELCSRFKCSFVVYSPVPEQRKTSQEEYDALLRYWIDRYRIAGKTYTIQYNNNNERI